MSNNSTTPLMKQYGQIKSSYPDSILLFRMGDFYETIGEDAVISRDARLDGVIVGHRTTVPEGHKQSEGTI